MIYAHMGIAADRAQIQGKLKLDYNKTVSQIYEELAVYWLRRGENVLELLEDVNPAEKLPGVASWVPDWRHKANYPLPVCSWHPTHRSEYRFHTENGYFTEVQTSTDGRPLVVLSGKVVGRIIRIGEILSAPLHSEPESKSISGYFLPDIDPEHIKAQFESWLRDDSELYSNVCGAYNRLLKDWAKAVGLDGLDDEIPVNQNVYSDDEIHDPVLEWHQAVRYMKWEVFKTRPLQCTTIAHFRKPSKAEAVLDNQWLNDWRICVLESNKDFPFSLRSHLTLASKSAQVGDVVASFHTRPEGILAGSYVLRPILANRRDKLLKIIILL